MDATALRALILAVVVAPVLGWSALRAWRRPALATIVQLIGALGHYFDLSGAAVGIVLLPIGLLLSRRKGS
jgi:hypothetical protein